MTTTSRRTAIKLGATALVVGPSVMFSRTARAVDDTKLGELFTGGQFIVKIDQKELPGVLSVDLGSVELVDAAFAPLEKASYTGVKIEIASKDAVKLNLGFAPEYTRSVGKAGGAPKKKVAPNTQLKLSVSLLASDGKTPAVTYHASNAVPVSLTTDMAGLQTFEYDIGGLEVVNHHLNRTRQKELLAAGFQVSIEGLGVAEGFSMSKAVYDWIAAAKATNNRFVIDGLDKASAATAPKFVNKVSLVTFVSGERPTSALISRDKAQPAVGKVKFWATAKGGATPSEGFAFSKAVLTSIELPKLRVGSDALVTETLHFKVEPTKG